MAIAVAKAQELLRAKNILAKKNDNDLASNGNSNQDGNRFYFYHFSINCIAIFLR